MDLATIDQELLEQFAHKIKNPIHAMGINLEVVKARLRSGGNTDSILRHVEIVESDLSFLSQLVLRFTRFAGPLETKKKNVRSEQLLRRAIQQMKTRLGKHAPEVDLQIAPGCPAIYTDTEQVAEALEELLANAAEASGTQPKIVVSAGLANNKVQIQIADRGKGIPAKDIQHVWQPFSSSKKLHTGMGLPIARRLLAANDAQLQLRSPGQKGAEAIVTFSIQNGL